MRLVIIFSLFFSACVFAQAENSASTVQDQQNAITQDSQGIDEVLVIGEQPGPGLWKVYKGDHVLWILGSHAPLPKFMQWHSSQVEKVIAESQEYILPPAVKVKLSTLQMVSVLPSAIGIKNNPDGEKLEDVLSPELYARWQILKEKYIGKNSALEKQRPLFAARKLYDKALEQEHLTSDTNIRYTLDQLAKQYKLRVVTPTDTLTFESPRKWVKQFKKASLNDMECFEGVITALESGLNTMRLNANAWARGDLAPLKKLPYFNHSEICTNAIFEADFTGDDSLRNIPQQALQVWMDEAEKSLTENTSTFAILPIGQLYHPQGFLAVLRAKGYEVVEPSM